MNEKFYDLSKEKQDKMLNGGMQIFALCGYKHASTDEMVKVTGVSKGLWFHYFENKKGLYYYICSYGVRYALLEMSMKIDAKEKNYFQLRKDIESVKASLAEKYPYLPLLISSILCEDDPEAVEIIKSVRAQYEEKISEILLKANYSCFEKREDAGKLGHMLDAIFDRIMYDEYRLSVFDAKKYMEEVEEYIKIAEKIGGA